MKDLLLDAVSTQDLSALARLWETADAADRAAAFRSAVTRGRLEVLRWQLAHGVDVNAPGLHGAPVLFDAAVQGEVPVGTLLLDAGAQVDPVDPRSGTTPLHEAARFGSADFVDLLLRRGARKDAVDPDGHNARTLALFNVHDAAAAACARHGIPDQPQFAADLEETRAAIKAAGTTG